jgi:hypothetical protein
MDVPAEIQQALAECPEVELSEWSADPVPVPPAGEDRGVHADPAPGPAGVPDRDDPLLVHDHPVPLGGPDPLPDHQEALPPRAIPEATAPPRRHKKAAVPGTGGSGNGTGEPTLDEAFLLTSKVASMLHLHPGSVLRMIARGDLVGIKVGGEMRIPAVSLEAFLVARKVPVRAWAIRRKGNTHGQG